MNEIHKDEFIVRLEDLKEEIKKLIASQAAPPVNLRQIEELVKKVEEMDNRIKTLKPGDDKIRINEEFAALLAMESDLVLDVKKPAPSGVILNEVFKTKPTKKVENFNFSGGRVIEPDKDYTLAQWINDKEGSKIPYKGGTFNNTFKTDQPIEKQVCLGTGTGKSTLFLRCLGFRGLSNEEFAALSAEEKLERGVTLVVPYKSLVGSVLSGHDDWLSDEQTALEEIERLKKRKASKEEIANVQRVIECPICTKKHTKYETVHNGPSSMINVFTWWEFLDAYVNEKKDKNDRPWIKQWVVFDEAHLKIPIFQALLAGLRGDRTKQYKEFGTTFHEKIKPFKIVEMSATFSDLPTSKKLSGTITDYYLNDFAELDIKKHPDIFKRKVIAFCDDLKKIDLKKLEEATKVLVLNKALKLYATDIVKSMESPLFVIASNDFSVGFSFGDVDVISTGEVMLPIVKDKKGGGWEEVPDLVPANSADLLQQRGRASRVFNMTAVWMSLVEKWQEYPFNKIKSDVSARALIQEFAKKDGKGKQSVKAMDKDEIRKIINHYKQEKPIPKLDPERGNQYINLILAKDLKSKMNSTLWNVTQEEKDKVEKQKKFYQKKIAEAEKKKRPKGRWEIH